MAWILFQLLAHAKPQRRTTLMSKDMNVINQATFVLKIESWKLCKAVAVARRVAVGWLEKVAAGIRLSASPSHQGSSLGVWDGADRSVDMSPMSQTTKPRQGRWDALRWVLLPACPKLRYAAMGTGCTLTAVPRSTQPSTLRGMVNEYQPHGWVIIPMVMGECSAYSSLQADSKVKFAAWPTSWRPPGADRLWPRWTRVNSCIWLAP